MIYLPNCCEIPKKSDLNVEDLMIQIRVPLDTEESIQLKIFLVNLAHLWGFFLKKSSPDELKYNIFSIKIILFKFPITVFLKHLYAYIEL